MVGDVAAMTLEECVERVEVGRWRGACGRLFAMPPQYYNVICPHDGCLLADVKKVRRRVVVEDTT